MASESVLRSTTRAPLLCRLLIAVAFIAALASYWSIPYRLAFGPNGSWYTCAYIADELYYIQRVQPLLPGASATNTVNGLHDPSVISPYYLEDLCRTFLSITGMNVITFVWAWRILLPCVIALLLMLIARECITGSRCGIFRYTSAVMAFALIPCCYDMVTDYPLPQLFINRVFTNIEYPLSLLMALLCLRLYRRPYASRGIALTLASVAVTYLRPYLTIPWVAPCVGIVIFLLIRKRMSLLTGFKMLGALVIGVLPWIAIAIINNRSTVYGEMVHRVLDAIPYQVHPHVILYLTIAAVLALMGILSAKRYRIFLFLFAFSMALIPFVSGIFSFNGEIVLYDRFGMFYWIALSCASMAIVGSLPAIHRFRRNIKFQYAIAMIIASACLTCSCALCCYNCSFRYDIGGIKHVTNFTPKGPGDIAYVNAYDWIRSNTPADALFLNDDSYDWSRISQTKDSAGNMIISESAPDGTTMRGKSDLFQIVARRRQVFNEVLTGSTISTSEYFSLLLLHRATFGLPINPDQYKYWLKEYRPTHILWRKLPIYPKQHEASVPRGYGAQLKQFCSVIYTDGTCEVWKINYPK